jgi:transcriptional regulator with XRE-family HTH domain
MSTEELGKALTEGRIARGLTLHDVERDTRISRKYLQALEEGNLGVLPAPVYVRAFMRTYAQYLGLDARGLVQQLPGAKPEPELPPLPDVSRQAGTPLVSASWLIAGVVVVLLLVVGLVLFWNRGGEGETMVSGPPTADQSIGEGGADPPLFGGAPPPTVEVEAGVVPDLETTHVLVALNALWEAGLRYLVIEVENDDVTEGTVFQQSPSPGTETREDTVVTLLVSR